VDPALDRRTGRAAVLPIANRKPTTGRVDRDIFRSSAPAGAENQTPAQSPQIILGKIGQVNKLASDGRRLRKANSFSSPRHNVL
jgi:hypothetical protein